MPPGPGHGGGSTGTGDVPAPGPSPARRAALGAAVLGLVVTGIVLRLDGLGARPQFIDEGESSINALSILERGYPADEYLGLPIFENTLTRPWPESEEYEFRDTSYSRRGFAIYHGWLPLYALAASLAVHGIEPDGAGEPLRVRHSGEEIRRRIVAARLPSVLFGGVFLLALFLAGRALGGTEAGLVALMVGTFSGRCIELAQTARYHSAALALGALAIHATWLVIREGRRRHFVLAGVALVLLFHTSSLVFIVAVLVLGPFLPRILRHEGAVASLLIMGGILGAGLLPWMLWTGYLDVFSGTPMARELLRFPDDYLLYPSERLGRLVAGAAAILGLGLVRARRDRLPSRLATPASEAWMPVLFLVAWIVIGYLGFLLLVPAASCFLVRLGHLLVVPIILVGAVLLGAVARALLPGRSAILAAALCAGLLVAGGGSARQKPRRPLEESPVLRLVDHLRGMDLAPGTRIYALPNQHFPLQYATGLPVQSVAPVRREFLDGYEGEVVILETVGRSESLSWQVVGEFARRLGHDVPEAELRDWRAPVAARLQVPEIRERAAEVIGPPGEAPVWVEPVAESLRAAPAGETESPKDYLGSNPAIFREYPITRPVELWSTFFYRFVGPEDRQGPNLNYAGRLREARATVLPSSWVVYRCPSRR